MTAVENKGFGNALVIQRHIFACYSMVEDDGLPLSQRNLTVDVLRGLAIFVMIGANMGGPVLEGSPCLFGSGTIVR